MKEQVLSIEQMKHFDELGVDTSKASLAWWKCIETTSGEEYVLGIPDKEHHKWRQIPTFTLQDMLEMMPKEIYLFKEKFILEIYPFLDSWYVQYMPNENSGLMPYSFQNYKIIDSVYKCLCWLAKQGFLKGCNDEKRD